MRGYDGLCKVGLSAVRFVRSEEIDNSLLQELAELKEAALDFAYLDFSLMDSHVHPLLDQLGALLGLDHRPYGIERPSAMIRFMDDLIGLSYRSKGMVIVIDRADLFISTSCYEMFDFVEVFLDQVDEWVKKDKPCYLCLQMECNDLVKQSFSEIRA